MLTLIVALAIVALGLVALFNMDRLNRFFDSMLGSLTKVTRDVLKYVLLGLLLLLWLAAVYGVYIYATQGFTPTISDSLDMFVSDTEKTADYVGHGISQMMDYDAPHANIRGLNVMEKLVEPGKQTPSPIIEYKMGPNLSDVLSGVHGGVYERYHTPRFMTGGDECSRTIKDTGNCWGVSRHFVDDQHINRCNKIFVRAPQTLPFNGSVNFPL